MMNKIKYILAASVIAAQAGYGALIVSNVAPTNVLTTSAWINGEVIDGTNPTLTLYYGTIDRTTNASSWAYSSNYGAAVVGNITLHITNLVAANKYYFRWYATEAGSNVWSVDGTDNFWTKPTSPTSTPAVVSISVQTDEDADLLSPTNFFWKNVSKIHDALSVYGYLTNEALWIAASGSVVYATDSTYTDTVAKAAAAYPSSNPSNFVDATITNDLNDVVGTKVTTNDTRQLDFTGADIRIADATETNQPVTKSQLDANSGTTNASGINVAFTPTNYTPVSADVEGHLKGVDAVIGTAPVAHTQDWSTITGTPTTISGYGITDAASTASVHAVGTNLSAHVADTSNPHGVTPAQIGAAPAAHTQDWSTIAGTPTTMAGYGITDGVSPTAWSAYPAQQIVDFASKGASNLARINAPNYSNLVWGYEVDAPRGAPGNGYGVIIGHATKGGDGSTVVGGLAQDYTGDCSLFGFSSSGRGVSTVAGMYGEATNRSTAVGFSVKAYNYSVALGEYSLADSNSVAIGHGITNLVPLSTRIKGKLLMAGNNIEDVGTASVSNLQIKADSPTNGAIWVATDTAGNGAWRVFSKFRAYATNYYSIGGSTVTKINFENVEFDNNSTYNTNTSKWIPGRAGFVHVGAQLYSTNAVAGKHMTLRIVRDGESVRIARANPAAEIHTWFASLIDYCPSTTNEYEIFAENQAGVTSAIRGHKAYTFFWGYELP